jgi:hypothetical protein
MVVSQLHISVQICHWGKFVSLAKRPESNPLQRHDCQKDHHVGVALVLVSSHGNPRCKINEESKTTAEILYEGLTQVVSSDDHLVCS